MAAQIVMDGTSDTRHNFDPKNASALLEAEERFKKLPVQALPRRFAPKPVRPG